jgi:hypothetical protein
LHNSGGDVRLIASLQNYANASGTSAAKQLNWSFSASWNEEAVFPAVAVASKQN